MKIAVLRKIRARLNFIYAAAHFKRYKDLEIEMNSNEIANIIYVGIIPIAAGTLAILLNYRIIGKRPGEDYKWDVWHDSYSKILKWVGPILIALGLVRIIGVLLQN